MSLRDEGYAFAGDALLVHLLRQGPSTIKEIAEGTGFSTTAIRNNLSVCTGRTFGTPWVEVYGQHKPMEFALTDRGRSVAGYRVRSRRAS